MSQTTDLIDAIVSDTESFTKLRREIHSHPEIAFQEQRTDLVAQQLSSWDFNDALVPLGGSMWVRLIEAWFAPR